MRVGRTCNHARPSYSGWGKGQVSEVAEGRLDLFVLERAASQSLPTPCHVFRFNGMAGDVQCDSSLMNDCNMFEHCCH